MRKTRNNALRMEKNIGKAAKKIALINKQILKDKNESVEARLKKEKEGQEEIERKRTLANLEKMGYNEARKLAASLGISIYRKKKAQILKDLKQHYEQSTTTY